MPYIPRNDFVLIRIRDLGQLKGIAMPQTAIQGKEFAVVAVGPKVEGLQAGDKVLIVTKEGVGNYFPLPNDKDMFVVQQQYVALIIKPELEERC